MSVLGTSAQGLKKVASQFLHQKVTQQSNTSGQVSSEFIYRNHFAERCYSRKCPAHVCFKHGEFIASGYCLHFRCVCPIAKTFHSGKVVKKYERAKAALINTYLAQQIRDGHSVLGLNITWAALGSGQVIAA